MQSIRRLLPVKFIQACAIICTVGVAWASLARRVPQIEVHQGDKIGHFLAYSVLTTLWGLYVWRRKPPRAPIVNTLLFVALGCCVFGIVMEICQFTLTTYRVFDTFDALANTIGVVIGLLLVLGVRRLEKG